uniref:AlNc14C31G2889 protein n=1 Tax=Albugo laibachii Nc14 TaxID=890382 RepID=F0W7T6_9STRA|nr:AlNc14C31G2889 [Albugo laibachii Nc14]|eukprot:CCA17188.1 AlNc14C31G2889 [Albugo laibachii Nc14]
MKSIFGKEKRMSNINKVKHSLYSNPKKTTLHIKQHQLNGNKRHRSLVRNSNYQIELVAETVPVPKRIAISVQDSETGWRNRNRTRFKQVQDFFVLHLTPYLLGYQVPRTQLFAHSLLVA